MAYGNKYKEKHSAVRFKKSYFIMQNKMAPLMFWVFKWGGMNLHVSTFISCHPVEILTHWLGRQVIQLLLKISRKNDLEKVPHTMSLTHWHTYHFALFYDCLHAHDNKRYHLWSVFSCFFSHYHSSWLLLLQWWWVQLLCVPLRMVNFELWPGETWTVKG